MSGTMVTASTPEDSKQPKLTAPSPAQDLHPYARGSVIEVWHVDKQGHDDDWWSEASDEEEEEDESNPRTIRLCDIIDRAPYQGSSWRYYVHYRDFNRRMDEWITIDKIVSPPSVGNAKARALKKEEEMKRKREEQEKQAAAAAQAAEPQRSVRRKAPGSDDGEEGPRRTRLSRRKSTTDGDDPMSDEEHSESDGKKKKTEILAVPGDAVTTQTIGEHVVATVQAQELDEHEGLDDAALKEHEEVTKVKNVGFLELGKFQMETWYFSPIPKELLDNDGFVDVLYVCEFSFAMFSRKSELLRHQSRIPSSRRHPPGNEIYRNGNLAMFEVDGLEEKIYCQNLCYIAKLFLDHKTLYYDVDPFLFYVLCEIDPLRGYQPVGYYSKEKYSDVGYNLACILTFPAHQRKGYGRFLIAFSYELSKKEEKVGSPEKPMSDLGQQAYKPYWNSTVIDFLLNESDDSTMSIMDISKKTSIMAEDIVYTLNSLGILKIINGVYFIAAEKNLLERLALKYPVKEPRIDASKLHWTPFLTPESKRDKFSIYSKKPSLEAEEPRKAGGF